jgi:hypothetical protein
MPRTQLSDERLNAIVAEVMATQDRMQDAATAEKMRGTRCLCCEQPIAGEAPGHTRECADCAGYA